MNTAKQTLAQRLGVTLHQSRAIAQIGCDLATAGRLEEARVIFAGMVTLNPKDSAAAGALGSVLQKLGRIEEAKDEYTRALAIDPKNVVALCGRGELRMRSGDKAGADDLKRAVQVDPKAETQAGKRAHAMVAASTKKPQPKVVPAAR
ncbi:MAG: tetratricopeptide repeat protein [Myxococcaceae bacterium]